MGSEWFSPFFNAFFPFFCASFPFSYAFFPFFLRIFTLFFHKGQGQNNSNLLQKWGISLQPRLHRPRAKLPDSRPWEHDLGGHGRVWRQNNCDIFGKKQRVPIWCRYTLPSCLTALSLLSAEPAQWKYFCSLLPGNGLRVKTQRPLQHLWKTLFILIVFCFVCYPCHPKVENAPTCYRAPKWPDPDFPRKIPKKYPPARNSGLPDFSP